jgi:hypothetical protein
MLLRARFRLKVTLPVIAALTVLLALVGTGPASAATGSYTGEVAIQANSDRLWIYALDDGDAADIGLPMAPYTSPASVLDLSVGDQGADKTAYSNNSYHLCIYYTGTTSFCTGLGMAEGTSPAIADNPSGGTEVAFQSTQGYLCLYTENGNTNVCTGLGMYPGTSPSIVNAFSGGYYDGFEVAFQSPQGHLCVYHSAGNTNFCTGLGMAAYTSPSLTDAADGGVVAFQANTSHLCIYHFAGNTNSCLDLGMAAGTSPSAYLGVGAQGLIAFQASVTDELWYYDTYIGSGYDTGLGMDQGSSPSVLPDEDLTDGADGLFYEIMFEANTDYLYAYDTEDNGSMNLGLGMSSGTSPSVTSY